MVGGGGGGGGGGGEGGGGSIAMEYLSLKQLGAQDET